MTVRAPSIGLAVLVGAMLVAAPLHAAKIVLVAGGGAQTNAAPALQSQLREPFGLDFDRVGNQFIVEMVTGQRVLKIDTAGLLTIIAGPATKGDGGDGKPAVRAQFNGMHNLAVDRNDDIYLADTWNNKVRKIDGKTGVVSTFAGTGKKGFSGDGGPADKAEFGGIYCVSFDPRHENLFLADLDNGRIRAVEMKSGRVRTVAGNGNKGVPADGASALDAPLVDPRAVAVDRHGNIYVLERSGHALRVVDAKGKIRTVVGTGLAGNSGDDGDARQSTLRGPKHLCVDRDDNVIIADTDNQVIRKFIPKSGKITRVAGSGQKGASGVGGDPLQVELNQPHGVAIGPDGKLYIVDSYNNRILRIDE